MHEDQEVQDEPVKDEAWRPQDMSLKDVRVDEDMAVELEDVEGKYLVVEVVDGALEKLVVEDMAEEAVEVVAVEVVAEEHHAEELEKTRKRKRR